MSVRASTGPPCACSGDRYDAVPSTAEVCGAVSGPSTRAMPKSITFTVPSRVTMTLPGLMSRWITPAACAAASAAQIFWAISAACTGVGLRPVSMNSPRVRPSMNSITMNCVPSSAPVS